MAHARAPRDAAVQHCLEYSGSSLPEFELEGGARSVVQFKGVYFQKLHHALRMRRSTSVDRSVVLWLKFPQVYELVRLVVHLAGSFYVGYRGSSDIPFVCKHIISVLASDMVRPDAEHTTTITLIIFLGCSGKS